MSRTDSENLSHLVRVVREAERQAEEKASTSSMYTPVTDPEDLQIRLVQAREPSYARFLEERRRNSIGEAKQAERANESKAFPFHRRR